MTNPYFCSLLDSLLKAICALHNKHPANPSLPHAHTPLTKGRHVNKHKQTTVHQEMWFHTCMHYNHVLVII